MFPLGPTILEGCCNSQFHLSYAAVTNISKVSVTCGRHDFFLSHTSRLSGGWLRLSSISSSS